MVGILPLSSRHTVPTLQKLQWLQFIPCLQQEDFNLNCYTDAVQSEVKIELQLTCIAVHCSTYFYESQCKWKVFLNISSSMIGNLNQCTLCLFICYKNIATFIKQIKGDATDIIGCLYCN